MARPQLGVSLAVAATITVLAAVASGLFLIGSPETERGRRIDARRVQDLDVLAHAIDCYWTLRGTLPSDLDSLASQMEQLSNERPIDGRCRPAGMADPETDAPYRYRVLSASTFELCATFAEPSPQDPAAAPRRADDVARTWTHEAGEQCFTVAATEISLDP
ncbi:hypothetical protein [Rhodospirillaceae bacterium SYSU D60014]|uniref:hypothetical protein n=1 Tax=Virgifigura deserti TaxID=2268457 RepID=UPI000E6728A2